MPRRTSRLTAYRKKRDFEATSEPPGGGPSNGRKFVIQKHAARRLHYDLRLEHDGVLLSWAVPKVPSNDPKIKRLAVHVEDHPVEYAAFEGTIPRGQYGAGTVVVWDSGEWSPDDDVDKALSEGKLTFDLNGKRLRGSFALVRMDSQSTERPSDKENWLFFRHKERDARSISEDPKELAALPGVRRSVKPPKVAFQLCTPKSEPPEAGTWSKEIKWDGYRGLAIRNGSSLEIRLRGGGKIHLPTIEQALYLLGPKQWILDGEIVALNSDGRSDFGLLQKSIRSHKQERIRFAIFDLLWMNGLDLRELELRQRQSLLASLMSSNESELLVPSPEIGGAADKVLEKACELGLEGLIFKDPKSQYVGRRASSWVKVKCLKEEDGIIIGYKRLKGSSSAIGSILIAKSVGKSLVYWGKIGTGYSDADRQMLWERLEPVDEPDDRIDNVSTRDRIGIVWVKPLVSVQFRFFERTASGKIRHAKFEGLTKAVRKVPAKIDRKASIRVTNPGRVLDEYSGTTKQQTADYYAWALPLIWPFVRGRFLSVYRCPGGLSEECFFQRHMLSSALAGVKGKTVSVMQKSSSEFLMLTTERGILNLVQWGALEFHPWGSLIKSVNRPDRLTFDLDPDESLDWERVVEAAEFTAAELGRLGMNCFAMLSGGKGIHVVCPIFPEFEWDDIKRICGSFVKHLVLQWQDKLIGTMSKSKRKGKVFVDALRNAPGATAVAPYSLRARKGLPVAFPISWTELRSVGSSNAITILNIRDEVANRHEDPWRDFDCKRVSLRSILL